MMKVTVPPSEEHTHNDRGSRSHWLTLETHHMNNRTCHLETAFPGPTGFPGLCSDCASLMCGSKRTFSGQWESHRKDRVIISFQKQVTSESALSSYFIFSSWVKFKYAIASLSEKLPIGNEKNVTPFVSFVFMNSWMNWTSLIKNGNWFFRLPHFLNRNYYSSTSKIGKEEMRNERINCNGMELQVSVGSEEL